VGVAEDVIVAGKDCVTWEGGPPDTWNAFGWELTVCGYACQGWDKRRGHTSIAVSQQKIAFTINNREYNLSFINRKTNFSVDSGWACPTAWLMRQPRL
jgi:hypothetical protein